MKANGTRLAFLTLALWFELQVVRAARGEPIGDKVTVHVQQNNVMVVELRRAELITTRIFAGIGVAVEFRAGVKRESTSDRPVRIVLQVDETAPAQLRPGALAYAMPFGAFGTRIRVFWERVRNAWPQDGVGTLLGYVMAHEIAHVLQGTNRHSANGIMKANWEQHDYNRMKSGMLLFDSTDSELILTAMEKVRQEPGANRSHSISNK